MNNDALELLPVLGLCLAMSAILVYSLVRYVRKMPKIKSFCQN